MSHLKLNKALAITLFPTIFTSFSHAGNFGVTTNNENDAGSLSEAIIQANVDPDLNGTFINFTNTVNGPINLSANMPEIRRDLTINFAGAPVGAVTINGNNQYYPIRFGNNLGNPPAVCLDTGAHQVNLNPGFW